MSDISSNLNLPYLMPSQAQKHVTVNETIRTLDLIIHLSVLDRDLTVPPATPVDGDRFLVAGGGTGAWSGEDGKIAGWVDGAWQFLSAKQGWTIWVADEAAFMVYDGSVWSDISGAGPGGNAFGQLGIGGATPDAINKLAVASDAVLFNHAGNGSQTKLNKNTAGDTASVLFQTGFSGRAEFGTTGDDDWHVKVSPDGSVWHEALVVDSTSGDVGVGISSPDTKLDVDGPIKVKSYTLATLPPSVVGGIIYVSDAVGGPSLAVGDGTGWLSLGGGPAPNQSPVIAGSIFSIDENLPAGTVVGTVTASDPDSGDVLSFAITAGDPGGLFAIDGAGQITTTAPLDFETTPSYALTVQVSDDGVPPLSDSATITVNVGDILEGNMPPLLANLDAWFDLSDALTITETGGLIDGVAKKLGNATSVDMTASGAARPTYRSSVAHSPNVAFQPSKNQFFTIPTGLTVDRQNCSVFHVLRREDVSSLAVFFGMTAGSDLLRMQQFNSKLSVVGGSVKDSGVFVGQGVESTWISGGTGGVLAGIGGKSATLSALSAGTASGGFLGKFRSGFGMAETSYYGSLYYDREMTPAEVDQVLDFLTTYYGALDRSTNVYIATQGDSLTNGDVTTDPLDYSWPIQMYFSSSTKYKYFNHGTGADTAQAHTAAAETTAQLANMSAFSTRIVSYNLGRNDLATSRTAAQLIADIDSWITAVRAADAGAILYGMTMPDSDSGANPQATFDADRATVNTHILTTANFDGAIDIAADARLSDRTNTTYYTVDQIHRTDAGQAVVAELVKAQLVLDGNL